jgi:hypothetical protein
MGCTVVPTAVLLVTFIRCQRLYLLPVADGEPQSSEANRVRLRTLVGRCRWSDESRSAGGARYVAPADGLVSESKLEY